MRNTGGSLILGLLGELGSPLIYSKPATTVEAQADLLEPTRTLADAYPAREFVPSLLAQLPWTHHLIILGQSQRAEDRDFYIRRAMAEKWNSRELERQFRGGPFERTILTPTRVAAAPRQSQPQAEAVDAYFKREVLPHPRDAWIDRDQTRTGYEIPFNRHFYVFEPPCDLPEIDTDLLTVTDRIMAMIGGLAA